MKSQEILIIWDRSGSMGSVWDDTCKGLDYYLDSTQETSKKEDIKTNVTLVTFNDKVSTVVERKDITEVPKVSSLGIVPSGMTSLNDAVGMSVASLRERLSEKRVQPKVLVVVLTDGGENSSKEYSATQIKSLMSEVDSLENWSVVMLGADIDAWSTASSVGIRNAGQTATYDKKAPAFMFTSLSKVTSDYMRSASAKSSVLGLELLAEMGSSN
jgi:uncharacterized protein YegL